MVGYIASVGLTVALFVALISEKAAPQYRVAVWLGVVGALMSGAASAMIMVPASCLAFAVLLLVVSARQAAVSQQLARLRFDRMVGTRREGRMIYYSILNHEVSSVIGTLYSLFCAPVRNEADQPTD